DSVSATAALVNLFQAALRVGKRAHTETSIDAAGASIVSVGVRLAASSLAVRGSEVAALADSGPEPPPLAGARVLVVGAGAVGSLAAATVRRAGAGELVVANRTTERAVAIAENYDGRVAGLDELQH
nr:hypothetical protein [Micromonospora sp. DSM 115978]